MIKNILFDLDGTLIKIDQDNFNVDYLSYIGDCFFKYGYDKNEAIKCAYEAIYLIANNDGKISNDKLFYNYINSKFEISRELVEQIFNEVIANDFDKLKKHVRKIDLASKIIRILEEKGYNLILATNAYFPISAIEKRASWGDIDLKSFSYITSIEKCNYCKPNINFYKQILENNKLNIEECLMVGNDLIEDLVIEEIGIPCYIITDNILNDQHLNKCTLKGNYIDFYNFVLNLAKIK